MIQEQTPTAVGQCAYKTLRPSRLYEQIVQQIEQSIMGGALEPGDQLPAGRELAQHFGVSRTAVRRAVKCLRVKGVLEAFSDKGTLVTCNTSQAIRQSRDWMACIDLPEGFAHGVEQRQIFEPKNASPAATRMDDQLRPTMREADVTMDSHLHDPDAYIEADLDFHLAMAETAGDPLVLSLPDCTVGLQREQRLWIFSLDGGRGRGPFRRKRILEAIEPRSPEAPRELTRLCLGQVHRDSTAARCAEETVRSERSL